MVTNVTAFGAFVDIGVHQDGLVHISQLSNRFVKDPHEVVKAGDKLKVRVLEVDLARKRISLTAKLDAPPECTAAALTQGARVTVTMHVVGATPMAAETSAGVAAGGAGPAVAVAVAADTSRRSATTPSKTC